MASTGTEEERIQQTLLLSNETGGEFTGSFEQKDSAEFRPDLGGMMDRL